MITLTFDHLKNTMDFLHIMHFNVKKNTVYSLHQILLATQNIVLKSLSHAFPYYLHKTQIKTIWNRKYGKRLKWSSYYCEAWGPRKKWTSRGMTAPSFSYRKIIYQWQCNSQSISTFSIQILNHGHKLYWGY